MEKIFKGVNYIFLAFEYQKMFYKNFIMRYLCTEEINSDVQRKLWKCSVI